jgi:acyl-CoA synthetase (NDP forming)
LTTRAGGGSSKAPCVPTAPARSGCPRPTLRNCSTFTASLLRGWARRTAEEAAALAESIGFPVALKVASRTITTKTDIGGVVLDLKSRSEVEAAFRAVESRMQSLGRAAEMEGVTVQRMVPEGGGVVGVTQDPLFGPLIMFGLGGTSLNS